jgi:hypothetical protein
MRHRVVRASGIAGGSGKGCSHFGKRLITELHLMQQFYSEVYHQELTAGVHSKPCTGRFTRAKECKQPKCPSPDE